MIDDIDTIAANSFRNFHAKGLDYLCLHRSAWLTVKAYFYENGAEGSPDVVCPHDHRYPFSTQILAGRSGHKRYREHPVSALNPTHECFEWRTPLLGGEGFSWSHTARLETLSDDDFAAGESYWCRADEVHTIRINRNDTVLLLMQAADVVPVDMPTLTFFPDIGADAPSLGGLYDRMTLDRAEHLLSILRPLLSSPVAGR